jgi:hypothetical protein
VELRIAVDGSDTDVEALWGWLRDEPALRGRLTSGAAPAAPGTMGAQTEFVLQLAGTVAGAGALWAALAQSLSTWLSHRSSDVAVTFATPDGRQVTVDAKRVRDVEAMVRSLVEPAATAPGEARGR